MTHPKAKTRKQTESRRAMPDHLVLRIENLKTYFYTEEGEIRAVDGVNLDLKRGSILGVVGESGCGKSVTAYSVLQLIQEPGKIIDGKIILKPANGEPIDITGLDARSDVLYAIRGGLVSMIFQEPMTALSPVHTIGDQIGEAILLHQNVSEEEAQKITVDMLGKVGIPGPELRLNQYPHEISGGMRQRVVIAMALVCRPELLIADEPTTALDVTIQAQVLALIKSLQQDIGTSVLLITHDLGVIAQMADDVAIMYLGRVVEQADVRSIMKHPLHPYTMGLLESLPGRIRDGQRLPSITGCVPSLMDIPPGCPFHPRCPHRICDICDVGNAPELKCLPGGHRVACHWHGRNESRLQIDSHE